MSILSEPFPDYLIQSSEVKKMLHFFSQLHATILVLLIPVIVSNEYELNGNGSWITNDLANESHIVEQILASTETQLDFGEQEIFFVSVEKRDVNDLNGESNQLHKTDDTLGNPSNPDNTTNANETLDLIHQPSKSLTAKLKYEFRYLGANEISQPILKHYDRYSLADFYPPWTYSGFYSPTRWHKVPIAYFVNPPPNETDFSPEAYNLRQHRSFMNLCSVKVTQNITTKDAQNCPKSEVIKNECDGDFPSPLNILNAEAATDNTLEPFEFYNFQYYYGFNMFLPPDGTDLLYVKLKTPAKAVGKKPSIMTGGGISTTLYLDRILFHIGEERDHGSEHAIDNNTFGMEIQFYFTSGDISYWEALSQSKLSTHDEETQDNVHIISVMVNVSGLHQLEPPKGQKYSKAMDVFGKGAKMFWENFNLNKYRAIAVDQPILSLEDIFETVQSGIYFTYEGSLTHPPCTSGVTWSVYEKPIWISYDTWLSFVLVRSEYSDFKYLAGNYRPFQSMIINTNLRLYLEMRRVENMPAPDQTELERIGQRDAIINLKYLNYVNYFSKKVRKLGLNHDHEHVNTLKGNEKMARHVKTGDGKANNSKGGVSKGLFLKVVCVLTISTFSTVFGYY